MSSISYPDYESLVIIKTPDADNKMSLNYLYSGLQLHGVPEDSSGLKSMYINYLVLLNKLPKTTFVRVSLVYKNQTCLGWMGLLLRVSFTSIESRFLLTMLYPLA